jgi:hypothetical protein
MATCSYCQQRKGKRSCPALAGAICSQCCGQHRLQAIACPSTCVYLGGLQVTRDPVRVAAGFTRAEHDSAWDKLRTYMTGASAFRDEALARCFDPPAEPERWDTEVAVGYLFYGHCDAGQRRLIDHFLAIRGRGLSAGEAAAVVAFQRAWASLFEVTSVQIGIGLELRDVLSGETVRVHEVSASGQLKKWDTIFTWLMPVTDHLEMTGAACLVPRQHRERVRAALETELVDARIARRGIPDRELVGSVAWVVLRALRGARRDTRMPALHTSDGEELVTCLARYAFEDEAAVRAGLAGIADLEAVDAAYRWFRNDEPVAGVAGAGSLTLGNVRLAGGELVLETMSRERHARGKQLLEGALGALISHRADETRAPTLGEPGKPSVHAPGHIPDDEERALVAEYLQDHYRRWIDMPLPALAGKTPRDAARTERGARQVEEMLKDIENTSLGMPGGEALDFAALRRELGIGPDDDAGDDDGDPDAEAGSDHELGYDAERDPDAIEWLETDDAVKARAVGRHHRALAAHPELPSAHMHAMLHVIVENQLADGEPPEVRATLERLTAGGLTRHEALHAIGAVMAQAMHNIIEQGAVFDREAAVRALHALEPEPWRFAAR